MEVGDFVQFDYKHFVQVDKERVFRTDYDEGFVIETYSNGQFVLSDKLLTVNEPRRHEKVSVVTWYTNTEDE